jgi:DNA-binding NtrC family response regulator
VAAGATLKVGHSFVRVQPQPRPLELRPSQSRRFGELVAESLAMREVFAVLELAAQSDVTVLVRGETGTGKELVARAVHRRSPRRDQPFVAVNCTAVPRDLMESEFFGHEKGAFTGADRRRTGRFEAAHGGTLFLDEVGELSPGSQAKLLRAIETSSFEPVGATRSQKADVRVLAATNRELSAVLAGGTFRRDLYYRLKVIDITAPPLRQRLSDVPQLVSAFLGQIAVRQGAPVATLEPGAVAALAAHQYPGNVRELLHALERGVALARGGPIRLEHLPPDMISAPRRSAVEPAAPAGLQPLGRAVEQFEQQYIRRALEQTGGHRGRTAAALGISRKSLWERLRDAGNEPDDGTG